MIRRLLLRVLLVAILLITGALITEYAFEYRDVVRYMPGQTFAAVGNSRVRYRLLGEELAGAPVVLLSGIGGNLEQTDYLQRALAGAVPSVAYDRAGYGFSEGSTAHTAEEQAMELAGLLNALKIQKPVVLVAYSGSSDIARVFAGRYPERTAAIYLIEPALPELDERMPQLQHGPLRRYARFVLYGLLSSSLGFERFKEYMHRWTAPRSLVEQRADAVVVRRTHYWALVREWYVSPESARQVLSAPISRRLPLELDYADRDDVVSKEAHILYAEFVRRFDNGKLVEWQHAEHRQLMQQSAALDALLWRVKQLAVHAAAAS